jgi:hypothetical protein
MKSKLMLGTAGLLFAVMMLVGLTSCEKPTLDQAIAFAKIGGMASARTWVMVAKPTPEQVKGVAGALDVTALALANYSGEGDFSDSLPQIYEGIDKLDIPAELKPMADSLAEAVVLGVDFWFAQNPDWKNKGADSAKIAKTFVDSAISSLPDATKTKVYRSSRAIKARELKK